MVSCWYLFFRGPREFLELCQLYPISFVQSRIIVKRDLCQLFSQCPWTKSEQLSLYHILLSLPGPFLELLLEKVELMPTNSFATNLLVTGLLSQLASYPQPLLKSVLIHPDVVVQPSIRSLFTAIASLRQKLDIIMPTFPHRSGHPSNF